MKTIVMLSVLLSAAVAAAQSPEYQPQPVGPPQRMPVQVYAEYQLYQVSPPQYVPVQPQRRRPRAVFGWGPFALGYVW